KHNRKIVPIGHQIVHERNIMENMRHTYSQRYRPSRPPLQLHPNLVHIALQLYLMKIRMISQETIIYSGRYIDGKIVSRHQCTGRNQCHQCNETFNQHCTVSYEQYLFFIPKHLRCRTCSDDRMETRNSPTGDHDKDERPYCTSDDRTSSIDKLSECRHFDSWIHKNNPYSQHQNSTYLEISRQIIPRYQQQPNRQHRRKKTVDSNSNGNGRYIPMEQITDMFVLHQIVSTDDSDEQ